MKIGVLALQGAFIEHEKMLENLVKEYGTEYDIECFEIRQKKDLEQDMDGLVLPGGESTVMGKLLRQLDLFETLKEKIEGGLPVLATCAGLILLAEKISNDENVYFGTLPVVIERNAYGRQLGSYEICAEMKHVGEIPMTFIRAPHIESVLDKKNEVEILATVNDRIVAVQYKNQIGMAFHPELTEDHSVHKYFVDICKNANNKK